MEWYLLWYWNVWKGWAGVKETEWSVNKSENEKSVIYDIMRVFGDCLWMNREGMAANKKSGDTVAVICYTLNMQCVRIVVWLVDFSKETNEYHNDLCFYQAVKYDLLKSSFSLLCSHTFFCISQNTRWSYQIWIFSYSTYRVWKSSNPLSQ